MRLFLIVSTVIVVAVLAIVTFTAPDRAALGAESSGWEHFHPRHYASYLLNEQVFIDKHPDYPDELYSYVENYPGLQIIWDGIAFSDDYNKPRGHVWSVIDTEETAPPKTGSGLLLLQERRLRRDLFGRRRGLGDNPMGRSDGLGRFCQPRRLHRLPRPAYPRT